MFLGQGNLTDGYFRATAAGYECAHEAQDLAQEDAKNIIGHPSSMNAQQQALLLIRQCFVLQRIVG